MKYETKKLFTRPLKVTDNSVDKIQKTMMYSIYRTMNTQHNRTVLCMSNHAE